MLPFLLGLLLGVVLGFALRGFVHRCPPASTDDGRAVDLGLKAGPITEQSEEK